MPAIKSTFSRRHVLAVAGGIAIALATAGVSHALAADGSVRTIKIATSAESKPLAWGAIGHEPQGYEPDLLRAINAKLPQYKFEMEGIADIAQETGLATGKYDMACGGYYKSPERAKQFIIPENPMGASLMKIYSRKDSGIKKNEGSGRQEDRSDHGRRRHLQVHHELAERESRVQAGCDGFERRHPVSELSG